MKQAPRDPSLTPKDHEGTTTPPNSTNWCPPNNTDRPNSAHQTRRPTPPRDDHGLTTLEWLLIVAAVAGIAALAVVLVQRTVNDTSESIARHSARLVAAEIAGTTITDIALSHNPTSDDQAQTLNRRYATRCNRLAIIYTDANINVIWKDGTWNNNPTTGGWTNPQTTPRCIVRAT